MVVHDWERKEYKALLNFLSVVKYEFWIYNVVCMFKKVMKNWTLYHLVWREDPVSSWLPWGSSRATVVLKLQSWKISHFKFQPLRIGFQISCCALRVDGVVYCNIRSKTNLLLFVLYIVVHKKIQVKRKSCVKYCIYNYKKSVPFLSLENKTTETPLPCCCPLSKWSSYNTRIFRIRSRSWLRNILLIV